MSRLGTQEAKGCNNNLSSTQY